MVLQAAVGLMVGHFALGLLCLRHPHPIHLLYKIRVAVLWERRMMAE